jgi:hypothetical protein
MFEPENQINNMHNMISEIHEQNKSKQEGFKLVESSNKPDNILPFNSISAEVTSPRSEARRN